jgi:hypothetical protein
MAGALRLRARSGHRRALVDAVTRRRRVGSAVVVPLALLVGLPVALAGLGGGVRVQPCVPGDGVTGWLGVHLALVQPTASCPAGELALGGAPDRMLAVMITLAVPVLLAHLAAIGTSAGAIAVIRAIARTVRHLVGRTRVPGAPARVAVRARAPRIGAGAMLSPSRGLLRALPRRGPPAVAIA